MQAFALKLILVRGRNITNQSTSLLNHFLPSFIPLHSLYSQIQLSQPVPKYPSGTYFTYLISCLCNYLLIYLFI